MDLTFQAAAPGKGSLSRNDVDARRRYCTERSLCGLKEDPAYKALQATKQKHKQLAHVAWLIVVLACALLAVIGCISHAILIPRHCQQVHMCPHLSPAMHLAKPSCPDTLLACKLGHGPHVFVYKLFHQ